MSWIVLQEGQAPHLFPGLGTEALCGVRRSVERPGESSRPAGGEVCRRCAAVIASRRAYWAVPAGSRRAELP